MDLLDLHGVKHAEARQMVIRFIEDRWNSDKLCEIITGHSDAMRKVAVEVIEEYKLEYNVGGALGTNPAIISLTIG